MLVEEEVRRILTVIPVNSEGNTMGGDVAGREQSEE